MRKKGQAAMEFLMTYGWAILVVLAAIGALAYFGVLNPSRLVPNRCQLSPGMDFTDCKAATTGLMFTLHNGLGSDLTSVNITINTTGTSSDVSCVIDQQALGALANGQTSTLTTVCAGTYTEGQRFDANVRISYGKSGENLPYTITGTINRKIEQ